MRTTLSPERLAQVHAEGMAAAGRFVDPVTINSAVRAIQERGEEWAESVLLRKFGARRSLVRPDLPWLNHGEEHILVAAAAAEWEQLAAAGGAE